MRALEAGEVRDERGVARPGPPRDAGEHLRRVRHLRHPLRAHEGRHLDRPGGRPRSGDRRTRSCRPSSIARGFVLQPVARADFDDRDARGSMAVIAELDAGCVSGCTRSPGRQWIAVTRPSPGARTGSSIFIASRTIRMSPRVTASPAATLIATTVAGIGAVSEPCACGAAPARVAAVRGDLVDARRRGRPRSCRRPPTANSRSTRSPSLHDQLARRRRCATVALATVRDRRDRASRPSPSGRASDHGSGSPTAASRGSAPALRRRADERGGREDRGGRRRRLEQRRQVRVDEAGVHAAGAERRVLEQLDQKRRRSCGCRGSGKSRSAATARAIAASRVSP